MTTQDKIESLKTDNEMLLEMMKVSDSEDEKEWLAEQYFENCTEIEWLNKKLKKANAE